MQDIKTFLSHLPSLPGIYQMLGKSGEVLYVGKARDLKKRVSSYFAKKQQDNKTAALLQHIHSIEITVTRDENEALLLECNLIKKLKPHYNVLFRDDKSYPYILITIEEEYPKIDIYRGHRKEKGRYFGPYPNGTAVRETIHLIEKLFQLRTCTNHFFGSRKRPCLQHQIGRCSGACTGLISKEEYAKEVNHAILFLEGKSQTIIEDLTQKMEEASNILDFESAAYYRNQITQLREIQSKQYVSHLSGEVDIVGLAIESGLVCIHLLTIRGGRMLGSRNYFPRIPKYASETEILSSFITQHYLTVGKEDIPKQIVLPLVIPEEQWLQSTLSHQAGHKVNFLTRVRGDRKKWQEMATLNAKHAIQTELTRRSQLDARFTALQEVLNLSYMPKRIECFDISHTMGEATVASCVVFNTEGPVKTDYRRFNITGITLGDDVGAMDQVLTRRFKSHDEKSSLKMPDIILIDGGKGQLNAAQKVLSALGLASIQLIGVAKGAARKPGLETLYFIDGTFMHLPSDSLALHLIQQIRDEAHRFAITGHRLRRDKKRNTSMLESIPGIGAKRRRELLRYFGGIQAIKRASLEEIAKVPGISVSLAESIFASLHHVGQ